MYKEDEKTRKIRDFLNIMVQVKRYNTEEPR